MAHVYADRVKETTTTTGTGTVTLAGAVTGYQTFAAVGDGNTCDYVIELVGSGEWEVGTGTYTLSGTTLARTTVRASSNAGSAVNFSAGTKLVYVAPLAGVVSPGQQTIWVPAAAMTAATTNGAASGQIETTTNNVNVVTLDFDEATDEYGHFQVQMPKSWDEGTVIAQFVWSTTATSGDCIWGLQAVAFADDDALDTAFGTAQTVTDTAKGTASDVAITAETSAITVAGSPGSEEYVCFRVYRDANAGGDTLAADARLHGVKLHYTVNTLKDD
jgi:hypothetical protein